MKKGDNRATCEKAIWDWSLCKRPAAMLTEKGKLLCSFHGGLNAHDLAKRLPPNATLIKNTKAEPYTLAELSE